MRNEHIGIRLAIVPCLDNEVIEKVREKKEIELGLRGGSFEQWEMRIIQGMRLAKA